MNIAEVRVHVLEAALSEPFFRAVNTAPAHASAVAKPLPALRYSSRGGAKTSSTVAPEGPARKLCGTPPGVRQKSPFLTATSTPP